jgi:P27 family predicted phage terminase small subunit
VPNQYAPEPIERMQARSTNGKTLGGRDLEVHDISSLPVLQPPPPPSGLQERGSNEWAKIWRAGKWLWPDQDYAWVEQVVRAYDDLDTFRAQVAEMGLTVEGYNGQTVANPLIAEMRKCEDTIRKCLSQLGFSPTDRARLKLTELKGASELQKVVNNARNGREDPGSAREYVEGQWG